KGFPQYALDLSNELVTVVKNIKQKFPNCSIVYLSGRTYGGYATSSLNPEPYAYESGFSVKWLIERQISGDTALACTGSSAKAPWLAWGPYLWADGLTPRSDGLTWTIDDFVTSDHTHPSDSGRRKVAGMLLDFLKTDPTAVVWFTKNNQTGVTAGRDVQPAGFSLAQNYPNPFNPSTRISYSLTEASFVTLEVLDPLGRIAAVLVNGEKAPGNHQAEFNAAGLASGIYFCRLRTGSHTQVIKILFEK
ncbi:MAG: T9SS type A sorting domain-containing protein, partial [Syntrophothermus sp.]